ncbi:YolD-like family protein [Alteribacillus sp. HJP-4]|uniref:YolD-like family protein n=1 Tax=Alteribacillus sp. HJP-4 TaxID=2775394 RepID=UPI0035CD3C52
MVNKLTAESNLRWESMRMILPEYREKWLDVLGIKRKRMKPSVDEQQWQEFEWLLKEAMTTDLELTFTFWKNGYFLETSDRCTWINSSQGLLHIEKNDEVIFIIAEHIADIRRSE